MKTLILGHGRKYGIDRTRNSPIDPKLWFYDDYVCVDYCKQAEPDILFDFNKRFWSFAKDEEYDVIIDASGLCLSSRADYTELRCENLKRILKPNGILYGQKKKTFIKQNGELVLSSPVSKSDVDKTPRDPWPDSFFS